MAMHIINPPLRKSKSYARQLFVVNQVGNKSDGAAPYCARKARKWVRLRVGVSAELFSTLRVVSPARCRRISPRSTNRVHGSQQMIRRDIVFYRELVEQCALRHLPGTHHHQFSLASRQVRQPITPSSSGVFQHNLPKAVISENHRKFHSGVSKGFRPPQRPKGDLGHQQRYWFQGERDGRDTRQKMFQMMNCRPRRRSKPHLMHERRTSSRLADLVSP